jgi:hypothetical protein
VAGISLSLQPSIPYPVNLSQFFDAFTAPLRPDDPVSASAIQLYNSSQELDLWYGNGTSNTTIAADEFVESMIFAFMAGTVESANPAYQLRGFLTYALTMNSFGIDFIPHVYNDAIQTYAISLSPISMPIFTSVVLGIIISCLIMLARGIKSNLAALSWPEVRFALALDSNLRRQLDELKSESWRNLCHKLSRIRIISGEEGHLHQVDE